MNRQDDPDAVVRDLLRQPRPAAIDADRAARVRPAVHAAWKTPQDIKNQYASASFVGKNRVVFNIKGNHYRLIVAVAYRFGALYIKFVGTHAEYDQIDAATVEME